MAANTESGDNHIYLAHLAYDAADADGAHPDVQSGLERAATADLGTYVIYLAALKVGLCLEGEQAEEAVSAGDLLGYLASGRADTGTGFDDLVTRSYISRLQQAWEVDRG